MAQGEVQGVSGVLPMAVVLGRAGVMTVQIRGVPFDVGAVTKDNVARFEVK
jgi:cytoskeleton protein RodZ